MAKRLLESTNPKDNLLASSQIQENSSKVTSSLRSVEASVSARKKAECEAKGGRWDEATQSCILPPATAKPVNPTTPEVFRDQDTGKLSGITLPDGKTIMANEKDVKGLAAKNLENTTLPAGTLPAGTAQNEANRQARLQQLMQQGLSPQELSAIQQAPIDWGQALTAGSLGNLPSVLTRVGVGAASGAAIGGVAGLGIGAIPGAIIGGAGGLISALWSGTASNIKKQQSGNIGAAKDVLSQARTNMRALSMIVKQDPSRAEEAIQLYYDQLAQVQRARRKVQVETQGNLNKFMEDGTDILSDFDLFLQPGGYADIQKMRLEQAIMQGAPATPEQMLEFYQEEYADGAE